MRHSLKICRDYDNLVIHPLSEEDLVTTTALRLNKPGAATPLSMPFMPAAPCRACAGLSCVPDYRLTPEHPFTATLISSAEVVAITRFARISQVFAAFTFLASRTSVPSVPFSCLGWNKVCICRGMNQRVKTRCVCVEGSLSMIRNCFVGLAIAYVFVLSLSANVQEFISQPDSFVAHE